MDSGWHLCRILKREPMPGGQRTQNGWQQEITSGKTNHMDDKNENWASHEAQKNFSDPAHEIKKGNTNSTHGMEKSIFSLKSK
jgi:hypothetical protein